MIQNERQYDVTKMQADKFRASIAKAVIAPSSKNVDPRLRKLTIDAMRAQLADLERELREYDGRREQKRRRRR